MTTLIIHLWVCVSLGISASGRDPTITFENHNAKCDQDVPSRYIPDAYIRDEYRARLVCKEGEYLDWYKCSPCEEGTFRTKRMARLDRLSTCLKCLEPGMYEIVKEPCTKTRDTTIMCEDGFYRHHVSGRPCHSSCFRCDTCGVKRNMFRLYEARECGGYHNTVCCHHDHMIVKEGKCHHKPTTTTSSTRTTQNTELNTFVFNSLEEQERDLAMSSSIQDITINSFRGFHFVISSLFVNMFLLNL